MPMQGGRRASAVAVEDGGGPWLSCVDVGAHRTMEVSSPPIMDPKFVVLATWSFQGPSARAEP